MTVEIVKKYAIEINWPNGQVGCIGYAHKGRVLESSTSM